MSGMGRRSALRLIGAAPLAVGFVVDARAAAAAGTHAAAAVRAAARGQAYKPKFFTAHEWETVRALADLILPRDERSGSATDAGVPEFIDFFMADPEEEDRARESRQTDMRGGLAWIDAECRRRFGHDFVECTAAERAALLDDIAFTRPGPPRPGTVFFNHFRDLTASGFWSSEMGVQDLQYVGNTYVAEWKGPPPEVVARLKLDGD
jgi:gluconate 2-dehydrogenase gamma chain